MPFMRKLLCCIIAGLVASSALLRIGRRFLAAWLPLPVITGIALLCLIVALAYPFYWRGKEKKQPAGSATIIAFWQGVIRYFVAIDLSMFGWQKIFHLQGNTPLGILDMPFSSLSGAQLTWAYYGHSYLFFCVVGALQITGSYLLLFKQTRLFGAVLLFPLLLNIILTDFFYGLEPGELLHAIILMLGVLYLLLSEYKRLIQFFFLAKSALPTVQFKSPTTKNAIRLSVVAVPLILIALYGQPDKNPTLTGKYLVKSLSVNRQAIALNDCRDSVLTIVYLDLDNTVAFEYNSQNKRLLGIYDYNTNSNTFNITWHYPPAVKDIFYGKFYPTDSKNDIGLAGIMGRDTLQAVLEKMR